MTSRSWNRSRGPRSCRCSLTWDCSTSSVTWHQPELLREMPCYPLVSEHSAEQFWVPFPACLIQAGWEDPSVFTGLTAHMFISNVWIVAEDSTDVEFQICICRNPKRCPRGCDRHVVDQSGYQIHSTLSTFEWPRHAKNLFLLREQNLLDSATF